MKRMAVVFVVLAASFATGCGVILTGTKDDLEISSSPSDAEVHVDGEPRGRTPTTVTVDSTESHTVRVEKSGFRPMAEEVITNVGAAYVILDVVLTGIVGIAIDAATGGWNVLDKDKIHVTLERADEGTRAGDPERRPVSMKGRDDEPDELSEVLPPSR